jgi:hypothetical protein
MSARGHPQLICNIAVIHLQRTLQTQNTRMKSVLKQHTRITPRCGSLEDMRRDKFHQTGLYQALGNFKFEKGETHEP